MKRFFIILGILFLCIGCSKRKEMVVKKTSLKEVSYSSIYRIINYYDLYQDVEIIDVRDEESYEEGHLIGARNIPYFSLKDAEFDSDKRIIVYGEDRRKSLMACRKLHKYGVVADYLPGIENYPYDLV